MSNLHPYVTADKYGRNEMRLEAFCRALATELGFPIEVESPGSYSPVVRLDAGDGLTLHPRAEYGAKVGRVEIHASAAGARKLEQHERPDTPSATVDSSRDIKAIARDVMRRVVEPGHIAAKATADACAKRAETVDGLHKLSAALMVEFPGLSITHRDNEKTADVYFNADGVYLTGALWPDGHLNIQRFSVSTADQARKLFGLMAGK
jgi:hypothetical protein